MRRRAVLILLLCFAGHQARAAVEDLHRPILAVWSAQVGPDGTSWCGHCDRFWSDYRTNEGFAESLQARFRVVYINADRRKLEGTLIRGIMSLPTFDVAGSRRIVGYTNPDDLLQRLGIPMLAAPVRPVDPPAQPLPAVPYPVGPKPEPPAVTSDNEPMADSRPAEEPPETKPPEAEPEQAKPDPPKPPENPSPAAGPQHEDASTSVVPQSGGGWITGVASTAAGVLWGPAGAAAVTIGTGLIGWFAGRRKKRQQAKQPPGSLPITDSGIVPGVPATTAEPALVEACPQCVGYRDRLALLNQRMAEEQRRHKEEFQRVERELQLASSPEAKATETRYVHVPVSDEAGEAYREAIRRVAELNPRAVSLLNQLESTAGQLLHGKKTKRGSAAPESKPGMWHDTEG